MFVRSLDFIPRPIKNDKKVGGVVLKQVSDMARCIRRIPMSLVYIVGKRVQDWRWDPVKERLF